MLGMKRVYAVAIFASLFACLLRAELQLEDIQQRPHAEIVAQLPRVHPVSYFYYTSRLWNEGQADAAVVWLQITQLRYCFHLAANPTLPPDGDAALFASLNATIGRPINQYAGGDFGKLVRQIDEALAW